MKRKNDSRPKQPYDEDLGFLDDRMQLLDTVRQMIDIEFERRRLPAEDNPHPENAPPENAGREPPDCKPPRRTLWQRLISIFTGNLS
ncbi:hypothetical protein M1B74_07615 [Bacteroides pyogenes]|uniref:hypothetical protein n=1 Tax=Bacteroides pyogenes TaxID=310300 RepID=UPI0003DD8E75|nr:hypothetical protein [Bacteroides pyogenes]MBB3893735.1 hypothetical protein [Bacteroides pyogenes]GAE23061.1 hypothetical protein JCM10003_2756 [Bacteroides pyogenes JCM 10003]SUV33623.1 Uncharacterised protein [Bacteroides pyogenes]